ncbi:MAG TPA: hypothetical protein V6C97_24770 [Oculatellaceae cyanobacterium]
MVASLATTAATSAQAEPVSNSRPPKLWIYGPGRDFWLIHGGAGIVTLPIVAASFLASNTHSSVILAYSLLLGLPHLCATHVRLHMDKDCQQRQRWLVVVAPLVVASIVATMIYAWNLLPALILSWFLLQTWHANRQNYGILRRYTRMADSPPNRPVNKLAEIAVELLPWASVSTALMVPTSTYMGYPIALPPVEFVTPIMIALWGASVFLSVAYLAFEGYELYHKRFVPGRFLAVLTGALVNLAAWVLVEDIVWGYLVVSIWHALQYISYVHAFRAAPPPGANVLKLSLWQHIALIFGSGLALFFLMQGMGKWLPSILIVLQLSMNFHHYLADAFIWKAPRPVKQT